MKPIDKRPFESRTPCFGHEIMPVKQFLSVPKFVMGDLAPRLLGWQGRSYQYVISETATDTQVNVVCHLKEKAQENPIRQLLSHLTLCRYLNRSLQQTHNQHCTPKTPRPPEIMCLAWMAHTNTILKTVSNFFSPILSH